MRPKPKFMSAASAILFCFFSSGGYAETGKPTYPVLDHTVIGQDIYFYPAAAGALLFQMRKGKLASNVTLYARYDRFGIDQGSAHRNWVIIWMRNALFDAWIDPVGHIHTTAVMGTQLNFGELLKEQKKSRGSWPFNLTHGRSRPLLIESISPTGILDRKTILIPTYRLELRYDALYAEFVKECPIREKESCASRENALNRARRALDKSHRLVGIIPEHRPSKNYLPDDWRNYNPGDPLWGLENVTIPYLGRNFDLAQALNEKRSSQVFSIDTSFKYGAPAASIQPDTLDAGTLTLLEENQRDARIALLEAGGEQ